MSESALAWRVQALARCGGDAESLSQATVGALAAGGHVLASVYLARCSGGTASLAGGTAVCSVIQGPSRAGPGGCVVT